jgi:hypothetical protein
MISIWGYTVALENDSQGKAIYYGEAKPGTAKSAAGWRIQKFTYSGSFVTDITWASGNHTMNKVWNDRATYVYS